MFRRKEQAPTKEEIYDVDLEHGVVTRKIDGSRFFTMDSRGWATVEHELASTFITGAAVILQRVGYAYGHAVGRTFRREEGETEDAVAVIQAVARESGWGQLLLNSGDLYSGQAKIVVRGCFFCLHAREATESVCHVLVGLIGGLSDELIGGTHRTVEEKCIAKGDPVCEILVEQVGS
jgi:predicted hydrocarbon binding protein